jgi:flagellar hook-associated protein 3 FlgL
VDLRITLQTISARALSYSRSQTDALGKLQEQASSGKRINLPEDDPLDAVAALHARAQDVRLDSELTNIRTARTSLDVGVSTLDAANKVFIKARELAIEASHSANDQNALNAIATEVEALQKQLFEIANTQHNGQYLFAGDATDTVPFVRDASGNVTYQGGSARAEVPVSPSQTVATFYVGSDVFRPVPTGSTTPTYDAFAALAGLHDDLRNTAGRSSADQAKAISDRLGSLDAARNGVLEAMGEMSANLQNLEGLENHAGDVQLETKKLVGDLEGADMADVVIKLQSQENLFRLTLATSARMFDQNLLDFLK